MSFIGSYNKSRLAYPATPLTCNRKVLLSCLSLSAYRVLCSNECIVLLTYFMYNTLFENDQNCLIGSNKSPFYVTNSFFITGTGDLYRVYTLTLSRDSSVRSFLASPGLNVVYNAWKRVRN